MTHVVRRLWSRSLAVVAFMAVGYGAVVAFSAGHEPAPKRPDPNGYEDFVEAGMLVHGEWPNRGDLERADVVQLEGFVVANQEALALARVGLGRESVVWLDNTPTGLQVHNEHLAPIRAVGRLFRCVAIVAEARGRFVAASRAYRDEMALGQAVTQGGMGMDQSLGAVLQWQGIDGLRKLRDRLPREEIAALLPELDSLDKKRIPMEAVEARWLAWYQGAYNPAVRLLYRLNGLEKLGRAAEQSVVQASRARVVRDLRFLLVELAIHAYHIDTKAWPRSVKDLVPKYLAAVPIDPNTNKPLDYPTNAAGELTDDSNSIARPDSELVAPKP